MFEFILARAGRDSWGGDGEGDGEGDGGRSCRILYRTKLSMKISGTKRED
jgi:hypothetical protein